MSPARWIGIWLRAWRAEPLEFASPLPVDAVRARLIEGSTSLLRSTFAYGNRGGLTVVGRVGTRRVSVQAVTAGVRNSWRPLFRGRLAPAGTGSELVGRLGWSPSVRAFSAVWLSGVGGTFVVLAAMDPPLCLVPLGFLVFFVGLTAWGIRAGRREATYLRSWLVERLRTAESAIPGYRPRDGGEIPGQA